MKRAAIQELFDYTGFAWNAIGLVMAKHHPRFVAQPAPGSGWPALRDCFGHALLAYDDWLAELDGMPMLKSDPKTASTWKEIDEYKEAVRARFQDYLQSLSDAELDAERNVNVDGEMMRYTPAQLLANILIHDRGHHGDVNTLLYQHGIPDDDWPWIEYRAFAGAKRGYS